MAMFHSLPSIHVKHQKNTAELESVVMPVPAEVTISMSQHIGAPCKPVVKVGDTVKVVKLHGEGPVKRRIMDMGITKGVEIYVRKVAPLGDPMELTVRNYELSVRKADAEMIEVV